MSKAMRVETILTVPSIEETVAWYERVLGWQGGFDVFDPDGKCAFGGVSGSGEDFLNGGAFTGFSLSRYRGDPSEYGNAQANFSFLIYVDDVDALYQQVISANWPTQGEPQDQFWGSRTFFLRDLNGFTLQFAMQKENPSNQEVRERYEAQG